MGRLLILLAIASPAQAEYRAFLLTVTNTQTSLTRTVVSTLDDIQYPGYFPLRTYETIAITETWMCRGRQGEGVRPCTNPRASSPAPNPPPSSLPSST